MPTCAIYARVSDESQVKGDSIQHQIGFCQEIARRRSSETNESWIAPEAFVYVDEGITGTSMVKRAEVQRLIRDARQKRFDAVLFKGISRFARDTVDALVMLRTLLACGVRVMSIEENFDSQRDNAEFVFTIHSALAQAESEKTAVRVRMGASQKARQGKWNGQPPNAYLLNPETKHLEIDSSFAPVIQEIFRLYLNGYGARKITDILNKKGQRTKIGNLWTQRSITRILTNPVYAGDVVYGRREQRLAIPTAEDLLARKKIVKWVDDPSQMIICRDAHPAIVDRETFNKANAIMASRRVERGRTGDVHLLSRGLMRCRCGSGMVIRYNTRGVRYYRCVGQAERGRSYCDQPFLRADDAEAAVLDRVRTDVLDLINLDEWDIDYSPTVSIENQLMDMSKQIKRLQGASQLLFEQFADGKISEDQFAPMNQNFRNQLESLRKNERDLINTQEDASTQTDIRELILKTMHQLLSVRQMNVRTTRQMLERLIEVIFIDENGLRITYKFKRPY